MKSILYTLGLVLALTAFGGGSACAQTSFKQAPLQLPGREFHMPMPVQHLPNPKLSTLMELRLPDNPTLMTRIGEDSVRVMPPDRMSCRVPDPRNVERMPVRKLQNSHPVDAMPTKRLRQ